MDLSYLLGEKGINVSAKRVLVMRHTPTEPKLRKGFPALVAARPDLFKAYQQSQRPDAEKKLSRAAYLASFIGDRPGEALFTGLYEVGGAQVISYAQYWAKKENVELRNLGMTGMRQDRATCAWTDLTPTNVYQDWIGKLVLHWPPGRAWCRWVDKNKFLIKAILEESALAEGMPHWSELILTWSQLNAIPRSWVNALSQLQCIYFILDGLDGKGYVGAAYGETNLYGRWIDYKASGDGGNKRLRKRSPDQFRFSILEVLSSRMTRDEVLQRESNWKRRLHTREFGLNIN